MTLPFWKVKRELVRFGQQLRAIPEYFWEPIALRRHNQAFAAGLPIHDGAADVSGKIALVLLYQPKGILDTTLTMCAHLRAKGYAPFILSNAPLSENDRRALSPNVWKMMERPNFGYDFGGYRDGILQLLSWQIVPDRLLILNDSIWFPLSTDEPLLTALEQSDADLSGTILRERGAERFLESYCYMIPKATFNLPVFKAFWRNLALTSNKYKVIRRGERGFSREMIAAGLRVNGVYTQAEFLARIEAQNDGFLAQTLRYASHVYAEFETARLMLLAGSASLDWRARVLAHIRETLKREQIYAAYPFAMTRLFNYPVLKKSNDRSAVLWRKSYMAAVKDGNLPPPSPAFQQELRCKVAADRL